MKAKEVRAALKKLDEQIIRLLNRRATLLHKAGPRATPDDTRQKEMLAASAALARGPLPVESVQAIYREVTSAMRALQQPLAVAFMGPQSSYTHQAAIAHFGSSANLIAAESVGEVFRAVAKHAAEFGVVPIENSNEGVVTHTLDMFIDSEVLVVAEVYLDIHHHLMSCCALEAVKVVYSHPMGFAQCRRWLAAHCAHARQADVYSTARAAEVAAEESGAAAVAGELAAEMFGLDIIAQAIEDYTQNRTRFLVIGREPARRGRRNKTSLLFSCKDRAGALFGALKPFRDAQISLTKIESRPSKLKAWEYYFYVDVIGHRNDRRLADAIAKLAPHCNFVRVLGSYPDQGGRPAPRRA
jgi:chorismate mutase/prephenate dehydratase